jgi:hypothetical protein
MAPQEAFLKYAEGAFQIRKEAGGTGVYLSDANETLYKSFVDSLEGVNDVEALVELLAMQTPNAARDLRYDLWIPVLRRIHALLGGDRDAKIAEVLVNLMYGEDDEAALAWEEAHDVYPSDPEVLKVGLVVAAVNRDDETLRICLDLLRVADPGNPNLIHLATLAEKEDWRSIQSRVSYPLHHNPWFDRASKSRRTSS